MKKIYLVGFALMVLFLCASTVSAGLFDAAGSNGADNNNEIDSVGKEKLIEISSDAWISGKITITEFKNVKANDDGSYNESLFYDKEGNLKGGMKQEIILDDTCIEYYDLNDETQFFSISYSIEDFKITQKADDNTVTVEYSFDNEPILTSSEVPDDDFCTISWGDELYSVTGDPININYNIK